MSEIWEELGNIIWRWKGERWLLSNDSLIPLKALGLGYHKIDRIDGLRLHVRGLAKFHVGGWVMTDLGREILELSNARDAARKRVGDGLGDGWSDTDATD